MTVNTPQPGGRPTLGLLGGERRWSASEPPKDTTNWAATALIVCIIVLLASWKTLRDIYAALTELGEGGVIAAGGGGQSRKIHVGVSDDPVGGAKRQANRCYRELLSFR